MNMMPVHLAVPNPLAALGLLVLLCLTGGCQHTRLSQPEEPTLYPVKGVVREIHADRREVIIKHDEIPGYMAAMTMPFEVRDAQELAGLQPGDQVSFVLSVTKKDGWISNIAKVGASAPYEAKPREATRVTRVVTELSVGDRMPDYPFTNELNQPVHLGQFAGEPYAITFFYTRCPFPTFCPRVASQFAEAAAALAKDKRAPRRWRLLSLTFDPDNDTPAKMRAYGLRFGYNPKHWSFLTGAMIDIDAITEQFGMYFDREGDTFGHNVRTVVVDGAGKIARILIGNAWKTEELVEALVSTARTGTTHPPATAKSKRSPAASR